MSEQTLKCIECTTNTFLVWCFFLVSHARVVFVLVSPGCKAFSEMGIIFIKKLVHHKVSTS